MWITSYLHHLWSRKTYTFKRSPSSQSFLVHNHSLVCTNLTHIIRHQCGEPIIPVVQYSQQWMLNKFKGINKTLHTMALNDYACKEFHQCYITAIYGCVFNIIVSHSICSSVDALHPLMLEESQGQSRREL